MDDIDALLRAHGLAAPWEPLVATGIANRIYATRDVVIRVAHDDPEALADAHTEWLAAPAAHAAGVLTPRLIACDDSRRLVATPYSIWERVDGMALGQRARDRVVPPATWQAVGRELGRLHGEVRACPDPHGWLDEPSLGDPRPLLIALARRDQLATDLARRLEAWLARLQPLVASPAPPRFVHGDLHEMNLMCRHDGTLAALIDWGDAGWGDPALDFIYLPIDAMSEALAAHEAAAPALLGDAVEARILWARLAEALDCLGGDAPARHKLDELLRFAQSPPARWRDFV
jgi:aminoglycoside phosphotransferase (APT) family kinase protein